MRSTMCTVLFSGCLTGSTVGSDTSLTPRTDATAPTRSTADTGDPPIVFTGTGFRFSITGDSESCLARWEVTPVAASLSCPTCTFSLSWQFDATYQWSAASTKAGCSPAPHNKDADAFTVYAYDNAARLTSELNAESRWWAWTPDSAKGAALVIGSIYGSDAIWSQLYPGTWDKGGGGFDSASPHYPAIQLTGSVVQSSLPGG
ncbi:MAG: hypothetical protein KTR31_18795 [Myxococcales bacterium]|nr:hypothetical protein [Myxococcales bacterium]